MTSPDIIYTCPMHPQVRQIGPGSCPICGMTLEPAVPVSDTGPNPELIDMRRRFWIGLPLALVVLLLAMGHDVRALSAIADAPWSAWMQLALASPVVLWCGWPFLVRGVKSVSRRSLNMFTLIALGVGAAYLYSVAALLVPQAFPADLRDAHGRIGIYFEAAAVIIVLVLLGQVLELQARERTGGAIRALLKLAPKIAHRVAIDGAESDIPLEDLRVGDRQRVRQAIRSFSRGHQVVPAVVTDFASITGEGVHGTLNGEAVALGNKKLMEGAGIDLSPVAVEANRLRDRGATVIFISRASTLLGLIAVADPIKASTPLALQALRAIS
jgi:Cu+-exporting ATPase